MSTTTTETNNDTALDNALDKVLGDNFSPEEKEQLKDKLKAAQESSEDDVPQEQKDISFLNTVFLTLFRTEPFLGAISMNVTKIADSKMPTAYIGARPNGNSQEILMGFNPKFMSPLEEKKQIGVIKHEIYHMIFQHIFHRSVGNKDYATLDNWAKDLAINSIIGKDNLPSMCLIPGHSSVDPKTGKEISNAYADYIKTAPAMKASDHYFEELKKIYEEQQDGEQSLNIAIGQGMGTVDDHGGWDQLPEDVQEQIRDKVREMMGKAAEEAQRSNSWGSVPHEIQQAINKLLSREVDWRSILRNFIGRTRTTDRTSTIRKINKKLPYIQPGVKRPMHANFALYIDQSGSMSDSDIELIFGELESLSSLISVDVYHFDTEIDLNSHTVWKKGSPHPAPHRTRCGGTDFNCIADFLNKPENNGKYAGVIIATDGYASALKSIRNTRVLWLITETGTLGTVRPGDLACQVKKERQFKKF